MKQWVEEHEKDMYDFIEDFSSSDYESVSEEEFEQINEYKRVNDLKLMHKNFADEEKIETRSAGGGSSNAKGKGGGINLNGSQNANGLLN